MKSTIQQHHAAKSIDLIQSSYFLTEGEHKLINLLASTMDSYGTDQSRKVKVSVQSYAELVGIPANTARKILKKSLESLWNREISWTTEKGNFKCRWLQEIGVLKDDTITVVWSDRAMEGLSKLQDNQYVQLVNEYSMILKGGYTIRLFEILSSERYIGNWDKEDKVYKVTLGVEDLMERLDVAESYKAYRIFKPNVILRGIEELEDKDIARIEFKEKKIGRKVMELEFWVGWLVRGARRKYGKKL